ncbi:MAG: RidA family protein [Pirellulaceae bacterium]
MSEIVRLGVTRRWSDVVIHQQTAYFVEVPDDPSADLRGQIQQVFAQVDTRLQAFGSDRTRLLQVVVYLSEAADLGLFNSLWDDWIPEGHAPSRACLHTRLAAPAYRLELVITAAVPLPASLPLPPGSS